MGSPAPYSNNMKCNEYGNHLQASHTKQKQIESWYNTNQKAGQPKVKTNAQESRINNLEHEFFLRCQSDAADAEAGSTADLPLSTESKYLAHSEQTEAGLICAQPVLQHITSKGAEPNRQSMSKKCQI